MLPSLSWLVGVRTADGFELGVGPNITPVGTALAAAMGKTFRVGILNVPVIETWVAMQKAHKQVDPHISRVGYTKGHLPALRRGTIAASLLARFDGR